MKVWIVVAEVAYEGVDKDSIKVCISKEKAEEMRKYLKEVMCYPTVEVIEKEVV